MEVEETAEGRKAARERRKALMEKGVTEWTVAELIETLTERYEPTEVPPCRVCGAELSIGSMGGGEPTRWACSGREEDPDRPGYLRWMKGRTPADDHYDKSQFVDRRQGGDELVMEAVRRLSGAARP
jgi:hypothetical protein